MSRKPAKKWELVMADVDRMIADSNANLYDRVTALKAIFDDPAFLEYHGGNMDKAEQHLNEKLGDFGIGYFEAAAMLQYFPKRDQWAKGKVREMLAHALEKEQERRRANREETPKRQGPISRREHEAVIKERDAAIEKVEEAASELRTLQAKVAELEQENAMLKGRIAELERVLARQLSAA